MPLNGKAVENVSVNICQWKKERTLPGVWQFNIEGSEVLSQGNFFYCGLNPPQT